MTLILAVALLQWLIVVAISFLPRNVGRASARPDGLKPVPHWPLISSTIVLAIAYINAVGVRHDSRALQAAVLPQQSQGSCALIEPGMSADAVRAKLGEPHEVRDDGKIRGPAAATWVYRDSRCAVHFLDEKVERIE